MAKAFVVTPRHNRFYVDQVGRVKGTFQKAWFVYDNEKAALRTCSVLQKVYQSGWDDAVKAAARQEIEIPSDS